MTASDFRELALALPGTVESSHMRHPDFRVGGRIFATLGYPDPTFAMVKLDPEEQEAFRRIDPLGFLPAAGAWGRHGATSVKLALVKKATVRDALSAAWRLRAPKAAAAKPTTKRGGRHPDRRAAKRQDTI